MSDGLPPGAPVLVLAMAGLWFACLVTSLVVHELGHALMARALGQEMTLHLAEVAHTAPDRRTEALILGAGPVLSAVQGIGFWLVWLLLAERGGPGPTVALMLGSLGLATAFGYLLSTPFTLRGDLGGLARLYDWPMGLRIALCVAGAAGLTLVARYAALGHLSTLPEDWRGLAPQAALAAAVILPWALASPVLVWAITLKLGLFSALYPVFAGSYLLIGWLDRPDWPPAAAADPGVPQLGPAALLAAAALVVTLVLRRP